MVRRRLLRSSSTLEDEQVQSFWPNPQFSVFETKTSHLVLKMHAVEEGMRAEFKLVRDVLSLMENVLVCLS